MLRRPLLIFCVLTLALVGASIGFLQSQFFARMTRDFLARSVPSELGVSGHFTEFGVQLFPPAVTVSQPELRLAPQNVFDLPADSIIRAERIDLRFQPLQMLTGQVQLREIRVVGGDIELELGEPSSSPATPKKQGALQWDQLVSVRVQGLALERSELALSWKRSGLRIELESEEVALQRSGTSQAPKLDLHGKLSSLVVLQNDQAREISAVEVHAEVHPDQIEIENLSADFGTEDFDFMVQARGKILGSVLDPLELKADLELQASGDLEALSKWAGYSGKGLQGQLGFEGRARADLLRLEKTFSFDGKASLKSGVIQGWKPDSVEILGRYESTGSWGAGRVGITSGALSFSSGTLALGALELDLRNEESFHLPLELNNLKLSDLLGPYTETVGNLEAVWSGSLGLDVSRKKKDFSIQARASLSAPALSLRSRGNPNSSTIILSARQPKIMGNFLLSSTRFVPEGLELLFPHSQFRLGGEVSWASRQVQWDLQAGGAVDFGDLESLGGSKILGKGSLQARVHGEGESLSVDFDTDLDAAEYIRLQFGMLNGRISLTEGMQKLTFHGVRGRTGASPYLLSGPIDFRGEGKMGLSFEMLSGRSEDFLRIFSQLTASLPGFPESLRGRLRARGTIGGTLSLRGMDIQTQIEGNHWSLWGEQIRAIKFRGGYQAQKYWADDLVVIKRSGSLMGRVAYGPQDQISWKVRAQNFSLRDFDWVLRLDVPITGDLTLQSEGSGKVEQLDSATLIRTSRNSIRGLSLGESFLNVESKQGAFKVAGGALGKQLQLQWSHDPKNHSQNTLQMIAEDLDFTPFLVLINPKWADRESSQTPTAHATGSLRLSYKGESLDASSGQVELRHFSMNKGNAHFSLEKPVRAEVSSGSMTLPEVRWISGDSSLLRAKIHTHRGEWSNEIKGVLDLCVLEFLFPWVTQTAGAVDLDFALSGHWGAPSFAGKADLRSGLIRIAGLDSPIENLSGRVLARQNKWTLSGIQGDLAQGRLNSSGSVVFYGDRLPELDLGINLTESRLKAYPFQYLKIKTAKVRLNGDRFPYELSGSLMIDEALSREKLANAGQGIALKTSTYAPPSSLENSTDFPKLQLKLDLSADSGLRFQNEFLDVEMKAKLTLINTLEAPRILGRAELVPGQGKITFKDHVFQIQSAQVIFDNPSAIDPRFELGATTDIGGTKVQLFTSGSAARYKVDFTSNPVMPEAEILSLLALGRTSEESRRLRSSNVSGIQQSEAASLILHSMDFNRDVKEKTGFQIGVGEAMDTTTGASAFRPQADTESSVAPKIVLKRQIGKRVDVSVGSTVGAGATTQREVNADVYLSPSMSVRGVWNYLEGTTTQDAAATQQGRTSYGLDLKVQKRFK